MRNKKRKMKYEKLKNNEQLKTEKLLQLEKMHFTKKKKTRL